MRLAGVVTIARDVIHSCDHACLKMLLKYIYIELMHSYSRTRSQKALYSNLYLLYKTYLLLLCVRIFLFVLAAGQVITGLWYKSSHNSAVFV